jgi:secreted trypsin-like serine protease
MRIALATALAAVSLVCATAEAADGGNTQRERIREREAALVARALERGAERETMRIIGGEVAGKSAWPWQVALLFADVADEYDAQFCGGTLIRRDWVVTAAHCVKGMKENELNVLTETNALDGSGVRRGVARIIVHSKFSAKTLEFDIALVKLGTSVPNDVDLAGLITDEQEEKFAEPGDNMFVTGWGSVSRQGNKFPVELREAKVPVVANDICNEAEAYAGDITRRMICAGELDGGKGVCSGDSGGPLLAKDGKGEFRLLAGVVSFGTIPCAFKKHPAVFTRITSFRDWILSKIKD